jgi:hypothetical protein
MYIIESFECDYFLYLRHTAPEALAMPLGLLNCAAVGSVRKSGKPFPAIVLTIPAGEITDSLITLISYQYISAASTETAMGELDCAVVPPPSA